MGSEESRKDCEFLWTLICSKKTLFSIGSLFPSFPVISETVGPIKCGLRKCVWVCEFVCFKYIDKGGGARRRMEHFTLMHHAARPCKLTSHVSATHIRPEYFIRLMFFSLNVYPKLLAGSSPSEPLYQLCFFKCFFFFFYSCVHDYFSILFTIISLMPLSYTAK